MNDQFIKNMARDFEALAENHNQILDLIERAIAIEENVHKDQGCNMQEDMVDILNTLKIRIGGTV